MSRSRKENAFEIRVESAGIARSRVHPDHISNGDESKYSGAGKYLASFTKGLPHDKLTGLIQKASSFRLFVHAINTGNPDDFVKTPLGPDGESKNPIWEVAANQGKEVRAWESQGAGHTYDLEGPDAQAVTMPPAPVLGSEELTAEMAEVYSQALLRDVPFNAMMDCLLTSQVPVNPTDIKADTKKVQSEIDKLNQLEWFNGSNLLLSEAAKKRRRTNLTLQTAYRGVTNGDHVGPYISQFLLAGSKGLDESRDANEGFIQYGSIRIDQRVRAALPNNYMETWDEWFDVQNGVKLDQNGLYETNPDSYRFIATPRDLATYVHNDALYEAYLNACLLLLANETKFDPGIPFQDKDYVDHQQGFAHFGGPHILSLLTEVATRALKAVRFQKFNVHRRMRPEVLAARLEQYNHAGMPGKGKIELKKIFKDLQAAGFYGTGINGTLLELNGVPRTNRLLPMAFREGSPMHPSYGAGHATVAGACVTILKAFFDHGAELDLSGQGSNIAFVSNSDGTKLNTVKLVKAVTLDDECLTVEGELNKLASNISIGRDWAGVHYYSDYIESIRLGEKIAIGILEEQKITYNESFSMTVPLFDGGCKTI